MPIDLGICGAKAVVSGDAGKAALQQVHDTVLILVCMCLMRQQRLYQIVMRFVDYHTAGHTDAQVPAQEMLQLWLWAQTLQRVQMLVHLAPAARPQPRPQQTQAQPGPVEPQASCTLTTKFGA